MPPRLSRPGSAWRASLLRAACVGLSCLALAGLLRAQDAVDVLLREELIELVLAHCRSGDSAMARQLATDVRDKLPVTPAVEALLKPALSGACERAPSMPALELNLSAGWDDNVNQGASASLITLGAPNQTLTLELDDSARPIASPYAGLSATHRYANQGPWSLQATAAARKVLNDSRYDALSVQALARRPFGAGLLGGNLSLALTQDWLAGENYHHAWLIDWQGLLSQRETGWALNANLQQHRYAGDSADFRLAQAGLSYRLRAGPQAQALGALGLTHDQPLGERAGGRRSGAYLNAGLNLATQAGQWQMAWSAQRWSSEQAFYPGLVDQRRVNLSNTLSLGYQRRLPDGRTLYVEYQHRRSQDNVAIYTFQINRLTAGLLFNSL